MQAASCRQVSTENGVRKRRPALLAMRAAEFRMQVKFISPHCKDDTKIIRTFAGKPIPL